MNKALFDRIKNVKMWNTEAFFHTFWHSLGTMLPLIIIGIICIFSANGNFHEFINEGDFCLFSAAILTPGIYTLKLFDKASDENKNKKGDRILPQIIGAISIIIILFVSILYVLIYIHKIYPAFTINSDLIVTLSWFFLMYSIIIFYYAQFINNADVNYPQIESKNIHKLSEQFRKL